jgi:hypothetical protein
MKIEQADTSKELSSLEKLSDSQLKDIIGGMIWERGTSNDDVVDCRLGQFNVFGMSICVGYDGAHLL